MDHEIKIMEIKCPGCGSTLKMPPAGSRFVKCEYCGGEYAVGGLQGNPVRRTAPDWIPAPQPMQQKKQEVSRASQIIRCGIVLILCAVVLYWIVSSDKSKEDAQQQEIFAAAEQTGIVGYGQSDADQEKFPGLLGEAIEAAFGRDADSVTEEELSGIRWIADKSDYDYTYIGYSFEDPLENEDAEIAWLAYPNVIGVRYESGYENLDALKGLKRLETKRSLSECHLKGLKLTGLSASIPSLAEAAGAVDDPSLIRELGIENNIESLDGLELFFNVETLSVSASRLGDVSAVTAMPKLKSLTLEDADALNDFSVFGAVENLEELSLASENIKVLNFVDRIPGLKSLGISDGKLLNLDGLEALENLEKLSVTNCSELENMKAVEGLSGLKELTLENPYDCEEPSLAGLTELEDLTLKNFHSCGFLQNLTKLKRLSLSGCDLPKETDLSALTSLKELSCTGSRGERSYAFVRNIPSLEKINMRGIVTYEDISGIFALPHLKSLDISGAECEINFDKIAENPSLESLEMAQITLYKNVNVSGGGGIAYVTQDNVNLAEHLDFLQAFPNLKRLNVSGNEIRDLEFAENLGKLEEIDLTDNYVTNLRPLAAIPSLRLVNCKGNPIENLLALDDEVTVLYE